MRFPDGPEQVCIDCRRKVPWTQEYEGIAVIVDFRFYWWCANCIGDRMEAEIREATAREGTP